jgi:AcrR family transcriptional regulator
MTVSSPPNAPDETPTAGGEERAPRRRDAAGTRQLLLSAARRRFASKGYAATTVREIADDAGVNVALISRYFESKEGLFEACLVRVSVELGTPREGVTLEEVSAAMAEQIAGPYADEHPNQLVLLLRTSGDERAERIRLQTLRAYAERLAEVAGGLPDGPRGEELLLRAQLALCAALGIAVFRSWAELDPLASVDRADLLGPVQAMIHALLAPGPTATA